jgi:integrase
VTVLLLTTLHYHGLRCEELCRLKIKDIHPRRGVPHLRVHRKGNKTRYIPLYDYLDKARHAADTEGAIFRPVSNYRTGAGRAAGCQSKSNRQRKYLIDLKGPYMVNAISGEFTREAAAPDASDPHWITEETVRARDPTRYQCPRARPIDRPVAKRTRTRLAPGLR